MKARWIRTLSLALVVFVFCPLWGVQAAKAKAKAKDKEAPPPAAAVETKPAPDWPAAELTVGFQTRDSETEGIGDLLIPLWNPGGTGLLFVNPRSAFTDHDAEEYNLGVGYRQLLPKQKVILGANAYYDYRDTGYTDYDQWGVGFELLSSWIDARANYYDPEDDRTLVGSRTETTTSQSARTSEGWGDPHADDHAIVQDYTLTRILTTTTTTRTFEQYEQALGGYDWEVGLRLPLPVKSETMEARVFAGAYDFDRDFGDDAKGWKARAEVRLLSSLFLDAGAYENKDLTGSDWFAGARLSVPFDLAKISRGRNPFSTAKSRVAREPRDFGARLTEMVMRDPQIRLETSKFIENPELATVDTSSTTSRERQRLTLMSDVNFVDGDADSAGDGSGDNPFPTIQLAVDHAFGLRNVYVYNASGAYEENVVLTPGVTLWGSSLLIAGVDGRTFGSGIAPVVDGMSMGPAITMADQTTVRGFIIRNTDMGGPDQFLLIPGLATMEYSRAGIFANGATDLTITENILVGNHVGALLATETDFSLRFANNLVTGNDDNGLHIAAQSDGSGAFGAFVRDNWFVDNGNNGMNVEARNYDEIGMHVWNGQFLDNGNSGLQITGQGASGTFETLIQDSLFAGNANNGLALSAHNFDLALAYLLDSYAILNGNNGAILDISGSELSIALASGVNASGNAGTGLWTYQVGNVFSLANLSDIAAIGNFGDGLNLEQDSLLASVGLIGMPEGLADNAVALLAGFGLTLPEELAMLLDPQGPVTAALNGHDGVQALLNAQSGIAAGALFDIAANNNLANGIDAQIISTNGAAIGLAGSSENLGDILQLASQVAGLFDLDLSITFAGAGHMQANNNGGSGFSLLTVGEAAAINAVAGLETANNGIFGTFVNTLSDNLGIAALARVNTSGNGTDGLFLNVYGLDDAAVGVIADVDASDNTGNGITSIVTSPDGSAFLLTLSTDLFRPVASLLGEMFFDGPITLPGESFGQVVASGNGGDGVFAAVNGDGFAAAAFLDTSADGNGGNGFNINVVATNGPSIAALVSSDDVLNLLNDMAILPPITFEPLGRVTALNNGANGVLLNQSGTEGVYALLAGVEADNNTSGDGIHANLVSDNGDAYAILVDSDAAFNADDGIDLTLNAYGYAISALVFPDVYFNGDQGIHIAQTSLAADSFALLSGADAWDNGGVGLWYNLSAAAGDAALAVTATESEGNGGRGGNFILNAGDEAALLVGTNALPLFDGAYAGFLGADVLETFGDFMPQGSSEFMDNGAGGLHAELTSTGGNVWFDVAGADAGGNTNAGFNIVLNALNGNILGRFNDVDVVANGGNGINLELNGAGGALGFWFEDVLAANNGANGINVVENYNGTVEIGGERIVSANNTANGVRIVASGLAGLPVLDFGGGALGSLGQSSIYGNGNRDFRYNNGGGATVMAENNWWGIDPPVAGQFAGSIDRTPWLAADPNAP